MTAVTHLPDGHEAYRDDAIYTAPEMRPGNGEDISPESRFHIDVIAGAGLVIGAAGGALAGEMLREEIMTPTVVRRF